MQNLTTSIKETRFLAPSLLVFLWTSSALAQQLPTEEYFEGAVADQIPAYWSLEGLKIVRSAETGTPEAPVASIRFEAVAAPNTNLFIPTDKKISNITLIMPSYAKGEQRTLYGTATLGYRAGQWSGPVIIENPVTELGIPADAFNTVVIPLGSEKEKQLSTLFSSSEIAQLSTALADKLSNIRTTYQIQIAALQQSLGREKTQAEEALHNEQAQLESAHQRKTEELKSKYSSEISQLMEDLGTKRAKINAEMEAEIVSLTEGLQLKLDKAKVDNKSADELSASLDSLSEKIDKIKTQTRKVELLTSSLRSMNHSSAKSLMGIWVANVSCENSDTPKYNNMETTYSVVLEFKNVNGLGMRGAALVNGGNDNSWIENGKTMGNLTIQSGLSAYPAQVSFSVDNFFGHSGLMGFVGTLSANHTISAKGIDENEKCTVKMAKAG